MKEIHLPRLPLDPFAGGMKILLVDLASRQARPEVMTGNRNAPASHMRIKNTLPRFSVVRQQPSIELHRLLCRVKSVKLNR